MVSSQENDDQLRIGALPQLTAMGFLAGLMSQSFGGYPTLSVIVRLAQLQSRVR